VTIAKGRPWGDPGRLPADGVEVHSDGEARRVVEAARRAGTAIPVLGLLGGDLCRTLGGTGDPGRLRSADAVMFPVDVATVEIGGRRCWFVAHLVAHNRSWTRVAVAMNAPWRGRWNLAPRAHPDDGLLDSGWARLARGDVRKVRARLPQGAHLPHPAIRERRAATVEVPLGRGVRVWLDGLPEPTGGADRLIVTLETDALVVVI